MGLSNRFCLFSREIKCTRFRCDKSCISLLSNELILHSLYLFIVLEKTSVVEEVINIVNGEYSLIWLIRT